MSPHRQMSTANRTCSINRVDVSHWTPETCAQKQQSASTADAFHCKSLMPSRSNPAAQAELHVDSHPGHQPESAALSCLQCRLGDGRGLPHTIVSEMTVAVDSHVSLLLLRMLEGYFSDLCPVAGKDPCILPACGHLVAHVSGSMKR